MDTERLRQILNLSGSNWRCAESQMTVPDAAEIERVEAQSCAASVPGEVRLDLLRAGRLQGDPFYGRNIDQSRWVEERDWWYWRGFDLALQPGQRAWLQLYGADYVTWTYLDGQLLGEHEGMFSRQVYEITSRLSVGRGAILSHNQLAVRFMAPARFPHDRSTRWWKFLNRIENRSLEVSCDPDRRDTLKCQMGYGWDFAPALRTIGLWDDVEAFVTGEVTLFDVQAKTRLLPTSAILTVSLDADASSPGPATIVFSLTGQTFEAEPIVRSFDVTLPVGRTRLTFEMDVPDPHLWFPWDRGDPDLYALTVEARRSERVLDCVTESVGLREITLRRNPDTPPSAQDWTFVVNGQPVYLRGANWVPADAFPARVKEGDYCALLEMARSANLNALRVWGGGLREKKAFYDICDRMGLMVWQEFPLACAFLTRYPRSPRYLALVESETREIVRQVRNHPSVVLWCGGNEFDPQRNRPVVEAMRRAAMDEDGTRPFQAASPSGGESHNWKVWHQFYPPKSYRQDTAQIMTEFGLQAPPVVESLRRFVPPDELWPPSPVWTGHRAQLGKLWHYAQMSNVKCQISNPKSDIKAFVEASQRAQAGGIQIAVEHARRRKYATSGFLVWQFNSPWPAIDWAMVDYYRVPKLAYHRLAEIANPLLVSLDYPLRRYAPGGTLTADVWVINDWRREFPGCRVEIALQEQEQMFEVNVKPDSAEMIGRVTWTLPEGDWLVTCRLKQGDDVLSTNHYVIPSAWLILA
jgi:beta-mannosidase